MLIIYLSCAWVTGIFLGSKLDLPWPFISAGLAPLFLVVFTRHRKPLIITSVVIITLLVSATYSFSSLYNIDEDRLNFYNDRGIIELKGMVTEAPDVRDNNTRLTLSSTEIGLDGDWHAIDGKALVFVSRYPIYEYGDILRVTGELNTPAKFDDFDYKEYLAHQGIYTIMFYPDIEVLEKGKGSRLLSYIHSMRSRLADNLAEVLPEPHASLAQGIILGMRGNIPRELRNDFAVTGTAHLLAISGLHLGIMAGILLSVGVWIFGKRHYLYVWLALGVIWLYVLITGIHLPVLRGAIMASMFLLAELLGRQRSGIVALTFAAAIMVGFSPYILGDASFQLSFLAMAGLVFLFPIFRNLGRKTTTAILGEAKTATAAANIVLDSVSATLAAVIAVWPVVAHYFGIFSIMGPVATLLVLPVLPAIITIGAFTGILGLFIAVISQFFGWLTWLFISYMILIVSGMAELSISALEVDSVNPVYIWSYYLVLAVAIWFHSNWDKLCKIRARNKAQSNLGAPFYFPRPIKWIVIPLLVAAMLVSYVAGTMPDDKLHVSFLDVGEGDAVLIQKGDQQVLIDGGPSPQAIGLELGELMPFWDRTIDLLILTHPHHDHIAGLVEVLRRYRVKRVIFPDLEYTSPIYTEWKRLIGESEIQSTIARVGQLIILDGGITIEVLNPPSVYFLGTKSDIDNNGVVLRVSAGDMSFLMTGDIMRETEREFIVNGVCLTSTVLKVAHHGSDTSTTTEFLAAVNPSIAVISCSDDNKSGHPNDEVINRLGNKTGETNIYITAENGTIEFITDGKRLWVEVENMN